MALVESGSLYLIGADPIADNRSIQHECEGLKSGPYGLKEAQFVASGYVGSLPTSMLEFYGYSAESTIVVDFPTSYTVIGGTDSDPHKNYYKTLVISGRQPGDIITLTMGLVFTEDVGNLSAEVYWSKNSTTVWTLLEAFTNGSPPDTSSESMTGINSTDVIRIRMEIEAHPKTSDGNIKATLTGGTITTGSGTVTASGTTIWQVYADIFF